MYTLYTVLALFQARLDRLASFCTSLKPGRWYPHANANEKAIRPTMENFFTKQKQSVFIMAV